MGREGSSVDLKAKIREYQKRHKLDIIIKQESGDMRITISDRARHVTAPYTGKKGEDMDKFICGQIAEFLKWGDVTSP